MAQVFIGIGSSIDKRESIRQGILLLKEHFGELRLSSVFESEAVGFKGGTFYNLVAELNSDLTIELIIRKLKNIEIQLGRPLNAIKYAARTLDLDLLLYDQHIDEERNIPRAEITENAFVLQPLAELAPALTHPIIAANYQYLWEMYPKNKQKLWKVEAPIF